MLLLPLVLLAVLFPAGDNQDAFQEPIRLHCIQISSFANSIWAETQFSCWLDDLQIHGWDRESATPIFLKPWSKGNFTDAEVKELVEIFRVYYFAFIEEVQKHASDFQLQYPFEIQGTAGCELHSGGAILSFLTGALGKMDFLYIKNHSCVPAPEGGRRAQKFCTFIHQYKGILEIVDTLLYKTCPGYLLSLLEAGKEDLEKQVKPEAWLSSGPSLGPGHLRLVCHVSGFYPKPVWVMWMRGDQEQLDTQRDDFLPYADGTWYLRATLDVKAEEAKGLSCHLKHSSLGGRAIILYWGYSVSVGLIIAAVIVPCLILLLCLALWFWKRWSYDDIP